MVLCCSTEELNEGSSQLKEKDKPLEQEVMEREATAELLQKCSFLRPNLRMFNCWGMISNKSVGSSLSCRENGVGLATNVIGNTRCGFPDFVRNHLTQPQLFVEVCLRLT